MKRSARLISIQGGGLLFWGDTPGNVQLQWEERGQVLGPRGGRKKQKKTTTPIDSVGGKEKRFTSSKLYGDAKNDLTFAKRDTSFWKGGVEDRGERRRACKRK